MKTQESLVNGIKVWLFPSLVTILSMMIWHDVNQIKEDVKALMAQSNIDKTRIDNLERRIDKLENIVLVSKTASNQDTPKSSKLAMFSTYFIKEDELILPKPPKARS